MPTCLLRRCLVSIGRCLWKILVLILIVFRGSGPRTDQVTLELPSLLTLDLTEAGQRLPP